MLIGGSNIFIIKRAIEIEGNMKNIKMIVTDMDGTLLNDRQEISKRTLAALIKAQERGITLVLASGRSHVTLDNYGLELQMNKYKGYFVCINGAAIFDVANNANTVIEQLGLESIKEIFEFARDYEVECMGVLDSTIYDYIPESLMLEKKKLRKEKGIAEDVPWTAGTFGLIIDQRKGYRSINYIKSYQEIPCPVNKISIANNQEVISKFHKEAVKKLGDKYNFYRTSLTWVECAPKNISKGKTLMRLMKDLGVESDQVIAFGDGENDLPLFEVAKYSVAMGNAMESVKAQATFITADNNSDGIAEIIEKEILN